MIHIYTNIHQQTQKLMIKIKKLSNSAISITAYDTIRYDTIRYDRWFALENCQARCQFNL